jgi:uncharacterized protein
VTPHRLARVERAETALRAALAAAGIPVTNVRVRDLGDQARVEVDPEHVSRVAGAEDVLSVVRAAGYELVEVDPRGFRSGSMNELLPHPDAHR